MEQAIFYKKENFMLNSSLRFDFCGFSQTLPFHSFGPAIREVYVLHLVLEGRGIYRVGTKQYHLKKGDLFLVRPGELSFYQADGEAPWLYCWLAFSGGDAEKIIAASLFQKEEYTVASSQLAEYTEEILTALTLQSENLINELTLNALTQQFLITLLKDQGKRYVGEEKNYSSLAIAAMNYIQEHFAEKLTVNEIAEYLAVDRSHLSRVFHSHLSTTLKDYLTAVRINQAAFLLAFSQKSIEEIALAVGFNSLVVFSRAFKNKTGETASHYRQRLQQETVPTLSLTSIKKILQEQALVSRAT